MFLTHPVDISSSVQHACTGRRRRSGEEKPTFVLPEPRIAQLTGLQQGRLAQLAAGDVLVHAQNVALHRVSVCGRVHTHARNRQSPADRATERPPHGMNTIQVSYDLHRPDRDYERLWEYLRAHDHAHVLPERQRRRGRSPGSRL